MKNGRLCRAVTAINGDIVMMHEMNWNYTKRIGEPYKAIILWADSVNGQPLVLKCKDVGKGLYNPIWSSWADVIDVVGHLELSKTFASLIGLFDKIFKN